MKDRIGLYTHRLYSNEDVRNGKVEECCKQISSNILDNEELLRIFVEMEPDPTEPASPCYGCRGCSESMK